MPEMPRASDNWPPTDPTEAQTLAAPDDELRERKLIADLAAVDRAVLRRKRMLAGLEPWPTFDLPPKSSEPHSGNCQVRNSLSSPS